MNILRRAMDLSNSDNVRIDGVLWNIQSVAVSDDCVEIVFSRMSGDLREMELLPHDLLELA